ncbi:hypothetical protein JZ751_024560 [Albula glossodonta]|uniref:Uncharacterized protein n=1 Tax=Albula glossodonta TaxID=121402 RepID=A0A8T2PHP1_9TELE|nr:hypothetical protein JZ751_024560 [Albula glossodonta]
MEASYCRGYGASNGDQRERKREKVRERRRKGKHESKPEGCDLPCLLNWYQCVYRILAQFSRNRSGAQ